MPLAVVSVLPLHTGRGPIDPWGYTSVHDDKLAEARNIVADQHVAAEFFEPAGDPADAIERVAEMGHFDTIVVGCRRQGAAARLLHGSVSERLATHANATVVVTRQGTHPGPGLVE